MPTNESIIAVPVGVEQPGQLRQFLVRLVEQIDIVIGRRGGDPYVPESKLNSTTLAGLSTLEQTILDIITSLFTTNNETAEELAIVIAASTLDTITTAIEALKSPSTISNANTATTTASASYVQAEAQAVADQVATNAVRFNSLLTALRSTGIIAT